MHARPAQVDVVRNQRGDVRAQQLGDGLRTEPDHGATVRGRLEPQFRVVPV